MRRIACSPVFPCVNLSIVIICKVSFKPFVTTTLVFNKYRCVYRHFRPVNRRLIFLFQPFCEMLLRFTEKSCAEKSIWFIPVMTSTSIVAITSYQFVRVDYRSATFSADINYLFTVVFSIRHFLSPLSAFYTLLPPVQGV